jgi:predicted amidohydrolase YtcJ
MAAPTPERPMARHAVVVSGGRIDAIVAAADLDTLGVTTANTDIHDHGDRLISPGFVDAHVHLGQIGLTATSLDLHDTRSLADVLDVVRTRAAAQPTGTIVGLGWDDSAWPAGSRPPTAADLDAVAPGRHVYLARVDVHSAVASPSLLAAAAASGLDGAQPDGRVARAAHHAVRDTIAAGRTRADRRADLRTALETAAGRGVVAVHELGAPHLSDPDDMALLADLTSTAHTPAVTTYWGEHADTGGIATARALGCRGAAGDLSADGAIGSRTAALGDDYTDAPGQRGSLYLDPPAAHRHVRACTQAGVQAGFHCIGDAAVEAVLSGFRRAVAELGVGAVRAGRHRIEHLELWPGTAVDRRRLAGELADWGVVASMQPVFDGWWGGAGGLYERRLGAERAAGMNPLRTLNDAGVVLALGSDAPVTPIAPWAGVRAAVEHHQESERLDLATAVAAHTVGGWYAAGLSHSEARREGELSAGHPANLVVWDLPDVASALASSTAPRAVVTLRAGRILGAGGHSSG